MGTFLAPFPSPRPVFPTADTEFSSTAASADAEYSSTILASPDAEFSSSIIALLAMHDDVGPGSSQPNAPFAADADADSANFPLLFAAHEHDHHQAVDAMMMPLPPQVFADLPVNPIPSSVVQGSIFPGAGEGGATGSTSRSGNRRRPQMRSSSQSNDAPGESSGGQAHAPDRARASRRVWVRKRSTEWWDHLNGPSCPDAEFRRAFRMSRATFGALCDALGGAVAKEDTALRTAIPVRQRVAVCLWRLATAEPLREVSRRFGLGMSTCHSIVLQPDSAATVATRFEAAYGLHGIIGAVYTTRVPVVVPKANVAAYYDRGLTERSQKASYSVAVLVVADADGAFTDVWIEPGSLSDAAVLGRWALSGLLGGHGQEQRLVGGTSYPLIDWMLVPYAHQNLTWTEHAFNELVAAARGVARGAVRRLKARWRCLQRRSEVKMQDLPSMIAACCVLHNVCERAGEELDPDLMQYELDDDDGDVVAHDTAPPAPAVQAARDRIAHGLLHGSHASN
ncbi:unnamed protein product [Miscanthus lutarioriparius]|uniref:DDE Tnp4 domain-containing protein n=1 Tax=Miscanthus lutarioriparius TaxID=422564 RepID=A0A811RWT5_9POAL|nr:unnamed protein product [Miscanthus lutarioriparius]